MTDVTQAIAYHPDPAIMAIADIIGDAVDAAAFPDHILRWRNDRAAADIGLAALTDGEWIAHFGRFVPLPGNIPRPLALRYHGHQFGTYNPELGDGRGFLFAQMRDGQARRIDLGTKGSGQTPYSRFGDGRLTLKGAVRELLATEMLDALGVATSRTFSIVETGEALHRGDEPSPTRSAVMVRMSYGHIRIGSFQRLAHIGDVAAMDRLLRYCLTTYTGLDAQEAGSIDVAVAAARLVAFTATRCAATAASYMVAGFVHGVLNTDNINITGESFDYGPWRFTPQWDPAFTAAYFDHQGLYAFGRQPQIIHWNVGQLAVALSALAPAEPLVAALDSFAPAYAEALAERSCWRLGVSRSDSAADAALVAAIANHLATSGETIDAFYAEWAGGAPRSAVTRNGTAAALINALAGREPVRGTLSEVVSMPIETVEQIWYAIATADDWQPLHDCVAAIRTMGAGLRG